MTTSEPLAVRMRPQTIDDILGQQHILGTDTLLYKLINEDRIPSMLLYGPPGTGKTTIANVIAHMTNSKFKKINAVAAGKKDLETVCTNAKKQLENNIRTILFIDEIHRFNKTQQDYLLPFVEDGTIILIGATTENPFFEVNNALVSRLMLFELKPIEPIDIRNLLIKALNDKDNGLGDKNQTITDDALDFIVTQTNGDARHALTILELASIYADTRNEITDEDVSAVIQKTMLRYDKDGDMHYDTISAFIKSMRGSDPDAVLYYLARMIQAGEDPKFIARRIMIHAAEDVGNADPIALILATNASLAAERIGFPEAQIILAQAATYVAMAPKSNTACKGISEAMEYVRTHPSNNIPDHLKDAHYKNAAKLGHGINYLYPHDFPDHWVHQNYLPDDVDVQFYHNSHMGYENAQAEYQNKIRQVLPPASTDTHVKN